MGGTHVVPNRNLDQIRTNLWKTGNGTISERDSVSRFEIRGGDLYDAHQHKVATSSGKAIFDENNKRIAVMNGDELHDTEGRKMASVRGSDIYDFENKKVGSFSDVEGSIKGAVQGILHIAFWYCFVR